MHPTLRNLTFLVLALTFGCGGTTGTTVSKDAGPETTTADSAGDMHTTVSDVIPDVPPDTGADLAIDFGAPEDVPADTGGPACEPGEGCFLDPCEEHAQCQSNWCVEHLGEGVCTTTCQSECPPGWSCQQVAGTAPDLIFVCVSDFTNLCRPCATANDCKSTVGVENVCVDYGEEGAFCGGECQADADCPWGFSCSDVVTVDGIDTLQCVAEAGVCPCATKSIKLSLWTECEVTNEFGTCVGKRVCAQAGLTDCDAPEPQPETCNGVDDDCDGLVDEPDDVGGEFVSLCDDGNECTTDTCNGEAGCSHESLTGTECKDGDICTTADHCQDGECVGSPVLCDDQNPCTDDLCTAEGGCDHQPNSIDCDDGDPCTVADECTAGACQGTPVACDCVTDADCEALENGDLCDGTLVCNTAKLPYQCQVDPATVVTCADPEPGPDAICQQSTCDPLTAQCAVVPDHEGFACSTGDACVVGETCQDGICAGGMALNCNDGNDCTADSCLPDSGCIHELLDGPCSDDNVCTAGDQCVAGQCQPGPPLDCDDDNPCTADSCSPEVGCVHESTIPPDAVCCQASEDCPAQFSSPLQCDDLATCQGSKTTAICMQNQCGSTMVADDSACTGLADACGHFKDIVCSGAPVQFPQTCPLGCLLDEECDPGAHCDDVCLPDLTDGEACDEDSDCLSNHCANGLCCATGDCCNAPEDCPIKYQALPLCDDPATCQGHRVDATCTAFQCGSTQVDDDTACTGDQPANECGLYPAVFCTGEPDQATPPCANECAEEGDCDPGAHCDASVCVPDADLGGVCDEDSDCANGLCHNGICCKESCTTDGCFTGQCDANGDCAFHTSGHQNCPDCHACDGAGQCVPQSADGSAATALGCGAGDEGCRTCNNGTCTAYTADQHGCPGGTHCDANGSCVTDAPDVQVVCWDAYPGDLGHWVSEFCPVGYQHDYHVCGASSLDSYSYGPYYDDKFLAHNNSNDHCWCCCNCNSICIRCVK